MNLTFDRAKHIHYLDGSQVPGITTALRDLGFDDVDRWSNDGHRDRGTAVHELCADIAVVERPDSGCEWDGTCGCGVENCRHQVALPYCQSYVKWLKQVGFVVEPGMVEFQVGSALFRCGAIIDQWGMVGGRKTLVELKSGKPQPAVAIQLAGQRLMLRETRGVETEQSYALWLDKEGGLPKIVQPQNPKEDERLFQSMMEVWWWRKANGMLPWRSNGNGTH